jgi:radical SAM protein with 4Fe4S-binding SPASM domain
MITNKYPVLTKKALIREEVDGAVLMSGSSPFKMITLKDLEIIQRISGKLTVYNIAKIASSSDDELGSNIIRVLDMAKDGIIELKDDASFSSRPALLSKHHPFSANAFSSPVLVSFGLTSECNRNCTHCYRAGYTEDEGLKDDEVIVAIQQLAEINIVELNFTGGEPFLNHHIEKYISLAASMIHSVTVSSNGTLITYDTLRRIKSSGVRRLQIGINVIYDSQCNETNEHDRKQITEMMKEATKEGIEITIGAVLTMNLIEHLESLFELVAASKVKYVRLGPVIMSGNGCNTRSISSSIIKDAVLKAKQLGKERQIFVTFGDGISAPDSCNGEIFGRRRYCFLGTGVLHFETDGSIYPCSALVAPEFRLGSLRHCPTCRELMNIWKNSAILKKLRNLTVDQLSQCSSCAIRTYCCGGCRTAAYWSTGDIAGASPYCDVSKEMLGMKCT